MSDPLFALMVSVYMLVMLARSRMTDKELERLKGELDATDQSLDGLWDEVEEMKKGEK
mgnify:FL=1